MAFSGTKKSGLVKNCDSASVTISLYVFHSFFSLFPFLLSILGFPQNGKKSKHFFYIILKENWLMLILRPSRGYLSVKQKCSTIYEVNNAKKQNSLDPLNVRWLQRQNCFVSKKNVHKLFSINVHLILIAHTQSVLIMSFVHNK